MSNKNKSFHFMSDVSGLLNGEGVPKDLELGETYQVEIPIFREGVFEHPWYGKLNFDRQYLDKMIENHRSGVVPQIVSFDVSHRPSDGAIAWVEDPDGLSIREKVFSTPAGQKTLAVLYAKVDLNQRGFRLLKGKEYRYFSSEIDSDFTTSEIHVVNTERGQAETVVTHGVTLVGGGITNRPFIPGLGKIEFSTESGEKVEVQDGVSCVDQDKIDGCFLFATGGGEPVVKLDAPSVPEPQPVEPVSNKNEGAVSVPKSTNGVGMKFSELVTKIETFSSTKEQIDFLKVAQTQIAEDDKAIYDILLKAKEQEFAAKSQADEAIQRKMAAERDAENAKASNTKLSNDLAEAREGSWKHQVQAYCEDLRKENHHESAIKVVEEILGGLKATDRAQKFSKIEGDGVKELGLLDILTQVFSSLPSSARLDLSEKTSANTTTEVHPDAPVAAPAAAPAAAPEAPKTAEFSAKPELPAKIDKFVKINGYEPEVGLYDRIDENGNFII